MDSVTTISVQELEELKRKAAKHDIRTKKAVERIERFNKENPNNAKERVARYVEKNRDAYNARRRELYRLKKEQSKVTHMNSTNTENVD